MKIWLNEDFENLMVPNSKDYNYNRKRLLGLCTFCKFHRMDNLRDSKFYKRSWKEYRKTQYKGVDYGRG